MPPPTHELLGGLTAGAFLTRHWQKRARLVRGAIAGFNGLISRDSLRRLAARDDVESRLIVRAGRTWQLEHGPFPLKRYRELPGTHWTLLVQGLNQVLPTADVLLRRFSFIPYARLDDVMVSDAAPHGGVGPHFDSYDVFLLQGPGRRRWRISRQKDLSLRPDAPLKLLARFAPTHDWTLAPGDMLYLPPSFAHDGVALDDCMTYSIGFRAPSAAELGREFLAYLDERLELHGMHRDPALRPAHRPAAIPDAMIASFSRMLGAIRWTHRDVAEFSGAFLSTPKPHVRFTPPVRALSAGAFARRAARNGLRLDGASIALYRGSRLYLNGEAVALPTGTAGATLRRLADARALSGSALPAGALALAHSWYLAGYLHLGES